MLYYQLKNYCYHKIYYIISLKNYCYHISYISAQIQYSCDMMVHSHETQPRKHDRSKFSRSEEDTHIAKTMSTRHGYI